ncbi:MULTISPECIES: AbgT family transporter [Pseudoalteromonas]|uniref:Aminobenzoyl-glutamate transporter n=1 Tax=Pseudoalteromonas ruthenica TaxID=151081 RepID=A0A0F4PZJ1_9GAMM|nr:MULTISPECIES: AbgT family transporter [Pseudoalteromonas]KJZ00838.1 aminobenzoyl-glutamate transporter [Pseudoalteromonas ruthenica]KJZ01109.1 aminobenzoyl-glutamate transporter [Pseudoalteromonas ruthenica]MCF2863124.1 AbgT family transporter [Pseudoalteromonas sp. CNAT2-18]MCG7543001.1 AbgT family transporter [Pseudoalteromonas sp. MM17-2]MCG7559276.1 AbgT family transporter [Pseudoalteromonas sp. CNAT2-18.1]|tara:strand:+ start:1273 stop:2829 length:1557 start_codon:yes stop_codon:yes gene_type:complete
MNNNNGGQQGAAPTGAIARFLNTIEHVGNKLPDPAMIFLFSMLLIWVLSWVFSGVTFDVIDPRTNAPIVVNNLLTGDALAGFLASMVKTFTGFAPLGVVLVAMLGVGVAEHSGYINTGIKLMLKRTPQALLTPMIILVGIVSHTATDAGYVLVIPLAGVIFYAMGRHPLAGIAAAFAGVSGGFSANFIPSGIDPLLQSFTQSAAQIINPTMEINPLNNYYFTSMSSIFIVLVGWYITDKIIEPRLKNSPVDGNTDELPAFETATSKEKKAFFIATAVMLAGLALLAYVASLGDSPLRAENGKLADFSAPIMQSIVPLIFLLFWIPGAVYGFVAGTFQSSKDMVMAMTKAMEGMAYYVVMAFFCALFIAAFAQSNLGALLAIEGAAVLKALSLPSGVTIVGIIFLTGFVNLFVGSSSAKWALLGPIFVPMLMQLNISPDLTQAAYRVGDSSSNIITPLMPYFPLVVVYCQKYVKNTGIGTLIAMMLPYSIAFLIGWSIFLLAYWGLDIPLGIQSSYTYG